MIHVFSGALGDVAKNVVVAALMRSVTPGLVAPGVSEKCDLPTGSVFVFVQPDASDYGLIAAACATNSKIVIFGSIPENIAGLIGLSSTSPLSDVWAEAANCRPAAVHETSSSAAGIRWNEHLFAQDAPFRMRPFSRFDYGDEWNNLGFGNILSDGSIWSIALEVGAGKAAVLAEAFSGDGISTPFVTLLDNESSSVLWWNRAAGPVDSSEWYLIEKFIADWRPNQLPCLPVIDEIPWGYDCAITMRLDCDEDIASSRPLFELYRERHLPFSVAIKTGQEAGDDDIAFLRDVHTYGGAILSHTVTHAPRWGGSMDACENEARVSSAWLEEKVPGLSVRYAVSPFHQNPDYVPEGLRRAGLSGFIGGIVANDPQMLLARGGYPPGDHHGVITHSQQCMMHGDCILNEGDPLAITKLAFLYAYRSRTLFGYLDHPFSERYDYGWGTEEHRVARHAEFLNFISGKTVGCNVAWLNENDALDWIVAKATTIIEQKSNGFVSRPGNSLNISNKYEFRVRFRGARFPLSDFAHE
jgi:hypothetical protein